MSNSSNISMSSILQSLLILSSLCYAIEGLGEVMMSIPPIVTLGDTVVLQCLYEMENEPLYAVNWYKGYQEFFRYVPNELPHARMFPQAGINVDVNQSGPHAVVIKNVRADTAGKYRCEVSADAPSFTTSVVSGYLNVILPPSGNVTLRVDKTHYYVGELLKANCSSAPSKPPSNITWFLNGKMVNSSQVLTYPTIDRQQSITIAKLSTILEPSSRGVMHIMCQSNMYTVYKSSDEEFVRIADNLDSYDSFTESSVNSGISIMDSTIILRVSILLCGIFLSLVLHR